LFEINEKIFDKKYTYLIKPTERNENIKLKLLELVKIELQVNHYNKRKEEACIGYINNNLSKDNSKRSIANIK